mgnify:FL=1
MREIVLQYIKNPTKALELKLTTMELAWAKKQIAANPKVK